MGRLLIANLTSCYVEITFTLQSSPFPRTFTDLTQYSFQTNQSQDSWYLLSDFGHKNLPDFKVVVDKMEDHREHVLYTENEGDKIILSSLFVTMHTVHIAQYALHRQFPQHASAASPTSLSGFPPPSPPKVKVIFETLPKEMSVTLKFC